MIVVTPTAPAHRLEEAEVRLVAKQEANALLNSQVDLLTKQLQELQEGKAAYEKHFKDLSALLAKERRQHAPHPKQVHLHSAVQTRFDGTHLTHTHDSGTAEGGSA